jgi:hypothetical protein
MTKLRMADGETQEKKKVSDVTVLPRRCVVPPQWMCRFPLLFLPSHALNKTVRPQPQIHAQKRMRARKCKLTDTQAHRHTCMQRWEPQSFTRLLPSYNAPLNPFFLSIPPSL